MISVIIPTYNRNADLEECLKSIRCNSTQDIEIIVMHPMVDEKTSEICKKFKAVSVNDKSRSGNSRVKSLWQIINDGIELANNDLVCWLNDDCVVMPEWDRHVASYFIKNPNLALLVLKTKGIIQSPEFRVCMTEYGLPVANYGVLSKKIGYRFDSNFSWFYGDVDLPMQVAADSAKKIASSDENLVIHNHRVDENRSANESDPRAMNDRHYFRKKWKNYKKSEIGLVKKNIFERLKIDKAMKILKDSLIKYTYD